MADEPTAITSVVVVDSDGNRATFEASAWIVQADNQLDVVSDGVGVASYAPGAWRSVYDPSRTR
jgi:hypothetical protein